MKYANVEQKECTIEASVPPVVVFTCCIADDIFREFLDLLVDGPVHRAKFEFIYSIELEEQEDGEGINKIKKCAFRWL